MSGVRLFENIDKKKSLPQIIEVVNSKYGTYLKYKIKSIKNES